jgi:hypothetical protein
MVHEYYDGKISIFHGPHKLASYDSDGRNIDQITTGDNRIKLPEAAYDSEVLGGSLPHCH